MALILADRVKVRSRSNGLDDFTLETVVEGYQDFSVIGDGNTTYYGITDSVGNWEIGNGTYVAAGPTLTRDSVISSSNSNNKVVFAAGTKTVFCTFPSSALQVVASASVDTFRTISVAGQSNVVADNSTDTLTLEAGANISITTDAGTDTITISSTAFDQNLNTTDMVSFAGVTAPYLASETDTAIITDAGTTNKQWTYKADGSVTQPGDITQSYQDFTLCPAGVDTVIYTTTAQYQHALKLFVMVEGTPDGGSVWETQACDIIAVRGYTDNVIHVTAYGVTYSSASAFATFDGRWNSTANRIEIVCRPTSLTNEVMASVHAIEMTSND